MTTTWPGIAADPTLPPPTLTMDGGQVWSWIRSDVTDAAHRIPRNAGITPADLTAFVPHQANGRIIDLLAERLELPPHVTVACDITETGNTSAGTRGFAPIPKRWAVERTYGWIMLHRRLARDYETLPTRSEAVIHIAMTDLMSRRLTGENAISWRDPKKKATKQPIPG